MFKDKLIQLSREQEDLFLSPSNTTPVRLLEIAEEKRLIGEMKAVCGKDSAMIKGFLKGRFDKIMSQMLSNGYDSSQYNIDFKAWLNVAEIALTKEQIESITQTQYVEEPLPNTFQLLAGAFRVLGQKFNHFSNKFIYGDENN